jgi:nucleotide-binding universal stress UspA family protein
MAKQVLIPVDGLDDARTATGAIPQVCESGDECIILAVLEEPEQELIGSTPTHVIPEPYTGAGGSEGPRAPNDAPVFAPREEMREATARDITESIQKLTQPLRDGGINVRAETVFSEAPAKAVLDYADDIDAQIMVTRHFQETLTQEDDSERFATVLPGT